ERRRSRDCRGAGDRCRLSADRHAYTYGNKKGVGRGLRADGMARNELFVTTKLNGEWHGYAEAQEVFAASADRLGLHYVDMYLIHWPLPGQDRYVDAWKGASRAAGGRTGTRRRHLEPQARPPRPAAHRDRCGVQRQPGPAQPV